MKTQHIGLAIALLVSTSFVSIAQTTGQKIGENPTTKHPGAVLDLESTDKGLLFPRVALSNTTTWGLAGTATKGMLIYNTKTTTGGFTGTTAYPVATGDGTGVYFWDGTGWAAAAKVSGGDPTKDAWIDDPDKTQVKLGTLSDGTTARTESNAVVIKDNGKVGIGTTGPTATLHVKDGDFRLENVNNWNAYKGVTYTGTETNDKPYPQLFLFQARGTKANPFYPKKATTLGVFRAANAIDSAGGAGFRVISTEQQTATAHGSGIVIFTTSNGSTNNIDRFTVEQNGNVKIAPNVDALNPLAQPAKSRLDLEGYVKLGTADITADALTTVSDRAGMIRYNSTSKALQYHDDTQWVTAASTADADLTSDAWVDDPTNTQVKLGTLSDGTTRSANAAFVAKDDGKVGIGTVSPVSKLSLEDNASGTYVQLATFLAPSNNVVNHNTLLKLGTSTTTKNSAELRFNYQDDGSNNNRLDVAFHGVGAPAFSVLTGGNVGIGTTAPSAKLEVNGDVEIQSVANVPNDVVYKSLVWNTSSKRVESSPNDGGNINKSITLAAGAASSIYTLTAALSGAYDVKVMVNNACGSAAYNKFILAGSNSNSTWTINHLGGTSQNGASTSGTGSTKTSKIIHNPLTGPCSDSNFDDANLDYTISVDSSTGTISIKNDAASASRTYHVQIEKAFN